MSDGKLPVIKPQELIRVLEKLGFPVQESQRAVISVTNIWMEEKQPSLSIKEKILEGVF
jgi:hypothetical protein